MVKKEYHVVIANLRGEVIAHCVCEGTYASVREFCLELMQNYPPDHSFQING